MSLIFRLDNLAREVANMREETVQRQTQLFQLVNSLVSLRQQLREQRQFDTADSLRKILTMAGVQLIDGGGNGRQIDDTWRWKE